MGPSVACRFGVLRTATKLASRLRPGCATLAERRPTCWASSRVERLASAVLRRCRCRGHPPAPLMRKCPDLGVSGTGGSRWITRSRPKIDHIAWPWLIRRLIDRDASLDGVPTAEVRALAGQGRAAAFDVPKVPITREGQRRSVDTLPGAFEPSPPALDLMAPKRSSSSPASAGCCTATGRRLRGAAPCGPGRGGGARPAARAAKDRRPRAG